MSAEDLERYETDIELQLYREYRDVLQMFQYVVETERRFYLANDVKLDAKLENGRPRTPQSSCSGRRSMFTSRNVTTRTSGTKRAGRYMSHTHASWSWSSK